MRRSVSVKWIRREAQTPHPSQPWTNGVYNDLQFALSPYLPLERHSVEPADSIWNRLAARPGTVCAAMLVLHAMLLAWSASSNSATYDEPAHLAAGCEYWKIGDYSIHSLSPPLLRLWAAAPAVLAGAKVPSTQPFASVPVSGRHWDYALNFTAVNAGRFQNLLFLSRLGMIPLSCAAGWICFVWAKQLYGPLAALAACTLYCFNPSILANASLATTDVGTLTALLLTAWLWWKFCRASTSSPPNRRRWIIWVFVCIAAIAAHLCKFTAIILWPMLLVMAVPFLWKASFRRRGEMLAALAGAFIVTLIGINAAYGFHGTFSRLDSFTFTSNMLRSAQLHFPAMPSPLPRTYLVGFDAQKTDTQNGYPSVLLGRTYIGTVWYYYPVALFCKSPLGTILLFVGAVFSIVRARGERESRRDEISMILAGVVYLAGVIFLSDVNIGTRYLLPAFPFAMIFTARLWNAAKSLGKGARSRARDVILGLAVFEAILVCPRFLSFVNYGVGGPSNGWWLLSDSDYDWGQGLLDLRKWMDANSVSHIQLCYFGYMEPRVYGIDYTPFYGIKEVPEFNSSEPIVISSYFVNGLPKGIPPRPGKYGDERAYLDFHEALAKRAPLAVIGNTLFVYSAQDIASARLQFWAQQRR
jgi:hypothetical protein